MQSMYGNQALLRWLGRSQNGATLQRKCACGEKTGGQCAECEKKEKEGTMQRKAASGAPASHVPPIVHDVLHSPGQPMDVQTRAFMESRFGYDFGHVRLHVDGKAAQSARAVDAFAYTVGKHVVFGAGRHEPTTRAGRELLAHELTHVVQQGQASETSVMSIGRADDPCEKEADRVAARAMAMGPTATAQRAERFLQRQADGASSGTTPESCAPPADMPCSTDVSPSGGVTNTILFPVASAALDASQQADIDAAAASWNSAGATATVRVDGYASAEYDCVSNWRLSCQRAQAVADELQHPTDGSKGVPAASISIIAHGESNEAGAALPPNRRATISMSVPRPTPTPTPTLEQTPPEQRKPADQNKCGPDITSALSAVLSSVDPYFRGLSSWQKRRSCSALDVDAPFVLVNPIMAWDTRELFLPNTSWLDSFFLSGGCGSPRDPGCDTDPTRNLCETKGTCGNTVLVGGKCMLAGTANYALYGKLFRLCHDEFVPDFPRWDMKAMIWLYKVIPDDPRPPLAMATTAFDGAFPTVPSDAENRGSCTGRCGTAYGGTFDFIWEPYRSR
jgi:outer membrane protein OmpA-like peptidoglycan-associated protein